MGTATPTPVKELKFTPGTCDCQVVETPPPADTLAGHKLYPTVRIEYCRVHAAAFELLEALEELLETDIYFAGGGHARIGAVRDEWGVTKAHNAVALTKPTGTGEPPTTEHEVWLIGGPMHWETTTVKRGIDVIIFPTETGVAKYRRGWQDKNRYYFDDER